LIPSAHGDVIVSPDVEDAFTTREFVAAHAERFDVITEAFS
jgi:hypothetical protein